MLALGDRLPLWSCVLRSIHETILRSGANPEMGLTLYSVFQEIGLPASKMHLEIPLGSDTCFVRIISDLVCSLQPLAMVHNVSLEELGDLNTLRDRICAEIAAANTMVSVVPLLGAWSRKPVACWRGAFYSGRSPRQPQASFTGLQYSSRCGCCLALANLWHSHVTARFWRNIYRNTAADLPMAPSLPE
jgi:hypothetical protein